MWYVRSVHSSMGLGEEERGKEYLVRHSSVGGQAITRSLCMGRPRMTMGKRGKRDWLGLGLGALGSVPPVRSKPGNPAQGLRWHSATLTNGWE